MAQGEVEDLDKAQADFTKNFPDPLEIKPPSSDDGGDDQFNRIPPIFKAHPDPFVRPPPPASDNPSVRGSPLTPPVPQVPAEEGTVNKNWERFLEGLGYLESSMRNMPPGSNPFSSAAGYLQDVRGTRAYQMRMGWGDPWAGGWENQRDVNRRWIEHDFPQAAEAIARGDYMPAIRILRGKIFPSLPGGPQQQSAQRYPEFWRILGGEPPVRFFGNPYGPPPPDQWGRDDDILKTARSTPGLGPPGYMPQGSEISSIINSTTMGIANGGDPFSQQNAIAMLRFRANYLRAQQQGQAEQAEILRQQQDDAWERTLRATQRNISAIGDCYSANEDDLGGFSECIYKLDPKVADVHNDVALQSALNAPESEVMSRVKELMINRHNDWSNGSKAKVQNDKATKEDEKVTKERHAWGIPDDAEKRAAEEQKNEGGKPSAVVPAPPPPISQGFRAQGAGGNVRGLIPTSAAIAAPGGGTMPAPMAGGAPAAAGGDAAAAPPAPSAQAPAAEDEAATPATTLGEMGLKLPTGPLPKVDGPYGPMIEFAAHDMVASGHAPQGMDTKGQVYKDALLPRVEHNKMQLEDLENMPANTLEEKQRLLYTVYKTNPQFAVRLWRWVNGLTPPPSAFTQGKDPMTTVIALGNKLDPTFNEATFKTRSAAWADLVRGGAQSPGTKITSVLLATDHLQGLISSLQDRPPGGPQGKLENVTVNDLVNWWATHTGVAPEKRRAYTQWQSFAHFAGAETANAIVPSGKATQIDLYGPSRGTKSGEGYVGQLDDRDATVGTAIDFAKADLQALHQRGITLIEQVARNTGWSPKRIVDSYVKYGPDTSDSGLGGKLTREDRERVMKWMLGPDPDFQPDRWKATAHPAAAAGPPSGAVEYLRSHRDARDQFDAKYGAGAAARALGE